MKDDENMVTVWTAKEAVVMEAIERDGVSYVKKEYLDKKYGETAWIFKTAYEFFVKEAKKRGYLRMSQLCLRAVGQRF